MNAKPIQTIIEELDQQNYEFMNLLLVFLDHGYKKEDGDDLKDIDAVCEYVSNFDANFIQKGLAQAKEILAMESFPDDWVCRTAGDRLPFDDYREDTPENYRAWVEWMVRALEEEARKVGKL